MKLYVNKMIFTDGDDLRVHHALTRGPDQENGSLILTLEDPQGELIYLPAGSRVPSETAHRPLETDYSEALFVQVEPSWPEGAYVVRSNLFGDEGDLLADDIAVFDICRQESAISGVFIRDPDENDTADIIQTRISLMDFYTPEVAEHLGGESSFSITSPAGRYYVAGEAVSEAGVVYRILVDALYIDCGEDVELELELERVGGMPPEIAGQVQVNQISGPGTYRDYQELIQLVDNTQNGEGECSKPKVLLMQPALHANLTSHASFISNTYAQLLRQISTGIELISQEDVKDVLNFKERQILLDAPGADDMGAIQRAVNAEYIVTLSMGYVGQAYVMTSNLMDVDNAQSVHRASRQGRDLDADKLLSDLQLLSQSMGNVGATIRAWEMVHPLPPRDPRLQITVTPESVVREEGKDEATVRGTVTDCKGSPVLNTRVYFRQNTYRGFVKGGSEDLIHSGYIYTVTDWTGVATATYVFNKGIKAGVDRVEVFTKGRGGKKAIKKAVIKIKGIGLEIVPENSEIRPTEETLVTISLFQEDDEGRTSMEGETVFIDDDFLMDGKLIPLGQTTAGGHPVTDANGQARMRFIAGKKEGRVRIPARYSIWGAGEEIPEEASIRIKEDAYILMMKYNTNGKKDGSASWTRTCSRSSSDGSYQSTSNKDWYRDTGMVSSTSFNSRTRWKRGTDEETTSANYVYHFEESIERNTAGQGSGSDSVGSKSWNGEGSWTFSSRNNVDLSSNVAGEKTLIIEEDKAGNLMLFIVPILNLDLPLVGAEVETWSNAGSSGGTSCSWGECSSHSSSYSGGDANTFTFDGDPGTDSGSKRVLEKASIIIPFGYGRPDSPMFYLVLRKTGKDRWEHFTADYGTSDSQSQSSSGSTGSCQTSSSSESTLTYEGHIDIRVVRR